MHAGMGMLLIFISMMTYLSCLIYSIVILISSGSMVLFPLLTSQVLSHIFLVVGIFLAYNEIKYERYNIKRILIRSFRYSVPNLSFLLLFSVIYLVLNITSGGSILFQAIQTLIYLNLYLLYGRR